MPPRWRRRDALVGIQVQFGKGPHGRLLRGLLHLEPREGGTDFKEELCSGDSDVFRSHDAAILVSIQVQVGNGPREVGTGFKEMTTSLIVSMQSKPAL